MEGPLSAPIEDWGQADDLNVIARLVALKGTRVVDVGCGKGAMARDLAKRGAIVLGIEPEPSQDAYNQANPVVGATFVRSTAEAIPMKDGAADVVLFGSSLHHVPIPAMDAALAEALRVLRKPDGTLIVLEPAIESDFARLMKPFHDETRVREAAQAALARAAQPRFQRRRSLRYAEVYRYKDFEAFVAEITGAAYNPHKRENVATPEVRALFDAGRDGADFAFGHDMRADVFEGPIAS
jgi:ubiquinone/menaquinone biosynthesis C-methylase UbiE